jgi:hypothetical protein
VTRADRVLVAALAVLALVAWPVTRLAVAAAAGDGVVVTAPGGTSVLTPRPDRTVAIEGLRGRIDVALVDGAVRIVSSPCPDQLCVRQGAVRGAGAALVCAPGGVSVRLGGGESGALDAVVR